MICPICERVSCIAEGGYVQRCSALVIIFFTHVMCISWASHGFYIDCPCGPHGLPMNCPHTVQGRSTRPVYVHLTDCPRMTHGLSIGPPPTHHVHFMKSSAHGQSVGRSAPMDATQTIHRHPSDTSCTLHGMLSSWTVGGVWCPRGIHGQSVRCSRGVRGGVCRPSTDMSSPRTTRGRPTNTQRTAHGHSTDCPWTYHRLAMDWIECASVGHWWGLRGQSAGRPRTVHGRHKDCAWTLHGLSMDRLSIGAPQTAHIFPTDCPRTPRGSSMDTPRTAP